MKNFSFLFIIALLIGSCDIVDLPLEKPIVEPVDTTSNNQLVVDTAAINIATRKVFVEEFTGHKCNGCPAQTEKLVKLQADNFPEIVVISYHAGEFSHTDNDYPTDFTTEYGDMLNDAQGNSNPYPFAVVKRRTWSEYADKYLFVGHTEWREPIQEKLNDPSPELGIGLIAEYSETTSQIDMRASIKILQDVGSELRLTVLIMEDSIIDDQKDTRLDQTEFPGFRNPDYVHRHVMRAQVNGADGLTGKIIVPSSGIAADEWIDWTHSYIVPTSILDIHHCAIIAFITNSTTGEIVQVEESHVNFVD